VTPVQRRVLAWYRRHGRAALPWRAERSPYRTVVSEFMLAQTQVERVVPKFEAFVARFADFPALAAATTGEVLRAWAGLGYNSRAVRLQRLARAIVQEHGGALPAETAALRGLPGVGPYTASAIRAFAYNLDDAPVDTNVRRIVNRLFFGLEYPRPAAASELDARARALVPNARAHDWSSALMDLGATICTARSPKCLICPLRTECVASPVDGVRLDRLRATVETPRSLQARLPYERTIRYARGRIVDRLRELPPGKRISLLDLHRAVGPAIPERSFDELREFVAALARDGLVSHDGTGVGLRE
jgi:A/G-specific adenine glycosylase